MALYFLNLKTFGRSKGSSAPSAAAYRSGERIRDERTGKIYDHTNRRDVLYKEIVLPRDLNGADVGWARDRSELWNSAERAETRKNARVAREYLVAVPPELAIEQRVGLIRGFAQGLSDRYRFAVDVALHAPRDFPGSDPRNFHAHLLATTREAEASGLGAKTELDRMSLGASVNELLYVRERWSIEANEALRAANVAARIDHRTLEAQGIERERRLWIPRVPYEMERQGYRSVVAERIREAYQARQDAKLAREPERHKTTEELTQESAERWLKYRESQNHKTFEELTQESAERWLKYRQNAAQHEPSAGRGRGRDDDFSL